MVNSLACWSRKRGVHCEGGRCIQQVMKLTPPQEPRTRICSQRANAAPIRHRSKSKREWSCPHPGPDTQLPKARALLNGGTGELTLHPQVSAGWLLWPVLPGIRTTDQEDQTVTSVLHRGAQRVRTVHQEGGVWGLPWTCYTEEEI